MASYLPIPAPPPGFRVFRGLLARLGRRRGARTGSTSDGSTSDGSAHPDRIDVPAPRPSTANPASARHRDRRYDLA